MRRFVAWSLVVALSLAACAGSGSSAPSPRSPAASSEPVAAVPEAQETAEAQEALEAQAGVADADQSRSRPLRLVTLGDAYTAGTDTESPRYDSWPAQLVSAMARGDVRLHLVKNLAEPGKTSGEVLGSQLDQVASLEPDVVTLQVGVNDIITRETDSYRSNVSAILDGLLLTLGPQRIFVITTPDHTLTEWGDSYGPREAGRAAVAELNATLAEVASARGIGVIDISPVNALVADNPSLVIDDGPYPTAKQYAGWVEVIGPRMTTALAGTRP